jgi:hypothetical protein
MANAFDQFDDHPPSAVTNAAPPEQQPEAAPTKEGPAPSVGRGLGLGVRDVTEGLAALPGAALDLVTWPVRAGMRAMGANVTAPSDMLHAGLTEAGLPEAETPREKILSTGVQGAASVLPTLGAGAVPAITSRVPTVLRGALPETTANLPGAAMNVLSGGVGAVAGEQAADAAPDWAKPYVNILGNMIGATAANSVGRNVGRAVNRVMGEQSPTLAAYDRLNIRPRLGGDVSGEAGPQTAQTYASQAPFSAGIVAPVEHQAVSEFSDAVEGTARMLGRSTNAQAAGETLQTEARNWRDTVFPQREQQAWAPVDVMMRGAAVTPDNYRASLATLTSRLAALPETQRALLPARVQSLLDAINTDVPRGAAVNWDQAQALRSALGRVMGVPEIVQSVGKDALTRAYRGISEDMSTAATAHNAGRLFSEANAVSTAGHAFMENHLSKIIRSNNPAQESIAPEQATHSVLGGGDTALSQLRQELPAAANEVAAYKLRDMLMARPGQAGETGREASVGTFLTDWNKLRQQAPNGAAALFSDPQVAGRLEDLATVASSIKETAKRSNVSRTGPFTAMAQLVPGAAAAYQGGGLTGMAATIAGQVVGNRLLGHAMTNEQVARFLGTPAPQPAMNPLAAGLIGGLTR